MISPVYQGAVAESSSSDIKTTGLETGMGQDAFLKMFMAQMTNQNPLDPMDNTEFTAQLAQFSSLEQLTKISGQLEGLDEMKDAANQAAVMAYLGKEVTVAGDVLPITDGHVGKVSFYLENTAEVRALVTDESGQTVAELGMGTAAAGPHEFQWDGTDYNNNMLPDGVYRITVMAHDSQGNPVEVSDQTVTALVTGYQKGENGESYLLSGDAAVPLSDVIAVRAYSQGGEEGPTDDDDEEQQVLSGSSGQEDDDTLAEILKGLATLGGLAAALL